MNDWAKSLDQNMAVHIIYLDFMKAFDKVSHEYLIHKLENVGIHQKILYWIQDFLNGRSQSVTYNNHTSSSTAVASGVPQGSVIGPASFVSFINDLPDGVSSKLYMFADDTKLYKNIVNDMNCQQLQHDIDNLVTWSTKWCLMFNPVKCRIMTLGHSSPVSD